MIARSLIALAWLVALVSASSAATWTVNSTADPGDGTCDATCTLRDACTANDAGAGGDTVEFAVPGAGPHPITLGTALDVAKSITLDGTTQSGSACCSGAACATAVWNIIIDGGGVLDGGLTLSGTNTTVTGVEVHNVTGTTTTAYCIQINGASSTVTCTHTHDCWGGIVAQGDNSTIGGTNAADRNVAHGNTSFGLTIGADNVTVQGNLVGFMPDGTTADGNGSTVVYIEEGDAGVVGGAVAGARNYIGGGTIGVSVKAGVTNATIEGNNIGLDVNGDSSSTTCPSIGPIDDQGTGTTITDNDVCPPGCCVVTGGDAACITALNDIGIPTVTGGQCADSAGPLGEQSAGTCTGVPASIESGLPACAGDDLSVVRFVAGETCAGGCAGATPTPGAATPQGMTSGCACCGCCGFFASTNPNTPTPTATPTPTPSLTPSTPGFVVECVLLTTSSATQLVDGTAWDLTGSQVPDYNVFLDYDSSSGSTATLYLHDLNGNIPGASTVLGIQLFQPGNALPNGLTTPFLPVGTTCNSWGTEPTNTLAQLADENGAPAGNDKATSDNITESPAQNFGGTGDLWGTTWTAAQINDPDFGIFLQYNYQTSASSNEAPCDLYHIVVGNNPDFHPRIQADPATFQICYQIEGTPGPTSTPTATGTATLTPSVTETPTTGIQEASYNAVTCDQTANGGTLSWTISSCSASRVVTNPGGTTFLFRLQQDFASGSEPTAGATIVGIEIEGAWTNSGLNTSSELVVQLLDSSLALVGDNKGDLGPILNGTKVYGGPSDNWSTSWTGTDVAGVWGFAIQVGTTETTAAALAFSQVSLTVYWTP